MLRASAPARVINVASGMYVDGNIDINSWDNEKKYSATGSYSDSKMAMVLSTFVLAGLFENEGITVNTLHPGFVTTGMGTNNRDLYGLLIRALAPLKWIIRSTTKYMISPVEGAKTSIYLASSPNVSKVTGKYFYKNKERRTTEKTLDANFQKKVWEFSMRQIRTALGDQSIGGDISNW
jgi:NAD(P)-dependent dehydrogenase (short-subunit alcohol dehydrogenase family)